jgi:hypothetical protein
VSEPAQEHLKGGVDAVVGRCVQVNDMGLFIWPLGAVITRDSSVVIEADPLGLLVKTVTHWDMEVHNFAIVECVASWRLIEGILIVEDVLFEVVESVFIPFVGDSGGCFSVSDGLEEPVCDAPE